MGEAHWLGHMRLVEGGRVDGNFVVLYRPFEVVLAKIVLAKVVFLVLVLVLVSRPRKGGLEGCQPWSGGGFG